ncbi:MAG: DUF4339 domain-containing protein [Oligoflexia bacterium]|nr:DUF4339 domain-containing protein [Oligoflexia bacterium]
MESTQSTQWYVVINGKAEGPFLETEIIERIRKGELKATDLVFKQGLTKWVSIGECPEFERRGPEAVAHTAGTFEIPKESGEGWVLLVKHDMPEGKHHYVQSGPFTHDQIKEKLERAEIKFEDHVWQKGMTHWTLIGSLDEFNRRRPHIEIQPKPQLGEAGPTVNTAPMSEPIPEVTPKPIPKALEAEPTVTSFEIKPEASTPQASPQSPVAEPEPVLSLAHASGSDAQPESPQGSKMSQLTKKQRLIIASSGALLGMLVVYAGLQTYRESIPKAPPLPSAERQTASQEVPQPPPLPPEPAAEPPVVKSTEVNQAQEEMDRQALGSKTQQLQPVGKEEIEVTPPNRIQKLSIMPLKVNSKRPQLVFETDLPKGSKIQIQLKGEPGEILSNKAVIKDYEVFVEEGKVPTVDLSQAKLKPGTYSVVAESSGMKAKATLSLLTGDKMTKKKIAEFKKKIAKAEAAEKSAVSHRVKALKASYGQLKDFQLKTKVKKANKETWKRFYKKWKSDLDDQGKKNKKLMKDSKTQAQTFKSIEGLRLKLSKIGSKMNKTFTGQRDVASEVDLDQWGQEFGEFRKGLGSPKK